MRTQSKLIQFCSYIVFILMVTLSGTGCLPEISQIFTDDQPYVSRTLTPQSKITTSPIPHAEVVFDTLIPASTPQGNAVYIEILDEVTGLALNPVRYATQSTGSGGVSAKIPIPLGSVVKYRYTREGESSAVEYTSNDKQVRYRLLYVTNPTTVSDIISGWTDIKFSGKSGRIFGQVILNTNRSPVPGSLVAAGGAHTLTSSDGSFLLEGVPVGKHNLVVYSLTGSHSVFQQEAVVAADSATPAQISVVPSKMVSVRFSMTPPQNSVPGIPIRMIGNITSLGNSFADLQGGISTLASRAPLLTVNEDGKYTLDLKLPVGFDLRYKYSIGDGFWNAEHSADGRFLIRQLIVPDTDIVINDSVATWSAPGTAPITFSVRVPANTPSTDSVSIQFNPYGWTEPLPMWPLGNNKWLFVLYSPLNLLGNVGYRYCRNDQCGSADDEATKGYKSQGFPFSASHIAQTFEDEVQSWAWMKSLSGPATVSSSNIRARGQDFKAGVELSGNYRPSWQPYQIGAIQNIKDIGANWIFISPAWEYSKVNPPVLEVVPGRNPLWNDVLQTSSLAKQVGLNVALYPHVDYETNPDTWWVTAKRDENWWQSWLDRYERYIIHHADLAAQSDSSVLIIGDDYLSPAYPSGKLINGEPSGVPENIENYWKRVIQGIRTRYKGKLYWAISYSGNNPITPGFLSDVDGIYALYKPGLPANTNKTDWDNLVSRQLDNYLLQVKDKFNKPIILGVQYPSASGAITGCIRPESACLPLTTLDQPNADLAMVNLDLQGQSDFYNSALAYINSRSWISGFVSRGFYTPAKLLDKSTSIYGKPAGDVVWFWFSKLLTLPK